MRGYASKGEDSLIVANADGTQEQRVAARRRPEFFRRTDFFYFLRPSWSPDGKSIACAVGSHRDNYMSVVEVQVEDGVERPSTSQKWFTVRQVAWLKDGSGLVITAKEQASSPAQVWLIRHPDGGCGRSPMILSTTLTSVRQVTPACWPQSEPSISPASG